jgi:fibronectin type 3 domain-containing protein
MFRQSSRPRRDFGREGAVMFRFSLFCLAGFLFAANHASANVPGGGTGAGPNVTLTDNGTTVTIANGIVSILCTKSGATINQINYTYNNGSGTTTTQLLSGGHNGGQLYWELGGFGGSSFTYTLVASPLNNGGNYAEIQLLSTSATNGTMEVHFSMLRGSTGFYVTAIWSHRSVDGAIGMGETRDNIYAGSIFNWMSVDAARNRLMAVSPSETAIGVFNAPAEVTLWTSGIYNGQYEDKYCYAADLGVQRVWGWSSVGAGQKNLGLWNVSASAEYYNGGPMKRELMEHIGTTILNMHNGSHYGGGTDGSWAAGEVWTKVYGPYFIYCNNVTNTLIDMTQASSALYTDALAQGAAEQTAWPYGWFTNANYAPATDRGTVTGTMAIADSGNPNASAANLWVGLVQQPSTTDGVYDFQDWMKPYQFWVKSDANGNFTISNVIAGANYTLYAFGPGAAGTFQSQAQTGGSAPNSLNIPASPFSVTVTGGVTNDLGTITWTPTRVGPTVFEIGYPNRTGDKFRHGDDYWVGDIGPSASAPSPIWSKHLDYPFEYPSGLNYTVSQSRWSTDWYYTQPIINDSTGTNFNGSTSTIAFNLPSAPAGGAQASFYIALSSDYQGPLIIQVNGNNIAGSTGYFPAYSSSGSGSDTTIRQGIHGCFSDNRINFSASFLRAGQNTITINMRKGGYFANHAMYDYIRLELTGYVPPPPAGIAAYAGNNCALLSWPVTPGATSYSIFRSTTSGSGYVLITNGVIGPVCGSGPVNATFLDTTAVNDTNYFYVVQSVNPTGASGNSPQSAGVTPSASFPATPPTTPSALIALPGNASVALNWNPSPGANFYTIQRSTVVNNGAGSFVTLSTITLNNTVTGTSFTDTTPANGSLYKYYISATSAGGTSGNAVSGNVKPLPPAPSSPPGGLTAIPKQLTNIFLNWSAVPGAVGYVVQRATSLNGSYTLLGSITPLQYTDVGLNSNGVYYYKVTAVNAAGTSTASTTTTRPSAPAILIATAGDTQATLNWAASVGATGYIVKRGISSGSETTLVSGLTTTNYTNVNLTNGVTYYYVVVATGSAANSGNSPEANATPFSPVPPQLISSNDGGQLTLSWPLDHLGWRLVAQTNAPGVGLTTNWVTVTGSTSTNRVFIPIDPNVGSVFFRLVHP